MNSAQFGNSRLHVSHAGQYVRTTRVWAVRQARGSHLIIALRCGVDSIMLMRSTRKAAAEPRRGVRRNEDTAKRQRPPIVPRSSTACATSPTPQRMADSSTSINCAATAAQCEPARSTQLHIVLVCWLTAQCRRSCSLSSNSQRRATHASPVSSAGFVQQRVSTTQCFEMLGGGTHRAPATRTVEQSSCNSPIHPNLPAATAQPHERPPGQPYRHEAA